ncbi:hypothetical protein BKH41_08850 [Helicobacter sp. 12S02232-10]|uniref:group III truncated hemoglobin n=1 Tax=Helicobacter sp. 12S02232-10 TaxID=1476197 RepID=UPI000BA5FF0D|nr:group III truncated hemoglobin [Helicobacter sp. 12S02232-10]PAF46603.1 hypothetical protein BKH41_08850 [Helicobacter sp. 12S02232-10]
MKYKQINTESIDKLMDIFYAKIRIDNTGLGALFNSRVGVSDEEWKAHKIKIANFWYGMLLGTGDYKGQPMKVHIDLPPFPRNFFTRWLELFDASLESIFEPDPKMQIMKRAEMIAQRFQFMIFDSGHTDC